MKKLAVFLLLVAYPVLAANATLTWTPPTTYTDNTPILPGTVITYNVYGGDCIVPRPLPKLSPTPLTVLTSVRTNISGKKCYAVTAIVNGLESVPSVEVMIDATPPPPPPPVAPLPPNGLRGVLAP